ncbi:MAG: cytochrome c class I [Bacteroidetes bacterium]|nr:MAG: cytochrome c class I [Bacteroidota bacterium]
MTYKSLFFRALILTFSLLPTLLIAQEALSEPDIEAGKVLFRNQCAACHNKNMKDKMTGPALGGVEERWADYPREDLYAWIRNSQALIAEGHPRAVELWNEWKPTVMNPFPNLTDQEIENLLAYIEAVHSGALDKPVATTGPEVPVEVEKEDNTALYLTLFFILGLLAIVLARIISNLNYMAQVKAGQEPPRRKTLVEILTSKGVVTWVIFALVVIGGFKTVNNAINLGRQQGYAPEQPIKFSHATHAGLHKIDCNYCHDGARRSKHSIIPAANTCMNCHRAIKTGSKYGTAELTKIFASVGYDPSTDKYIENYENLSREEIERIYKKWIADQYVSETGTLDDEGERLIEEQWNGIVEALTDPKTGDDKIAGPIEWVRIHNLPDHVYFSHAQHVTVGKIECQTCHGKAEAMEVVEQYSPLSMGWCINCHRKTEVQFAGNEYYESYELYHKQLATGEREKVTVEDIGGIECQKCHY